MFLLVRVVVIHHEEHVASQQPYVDMRCIAEKAQHLPVAEMEVPRVNNLCNVAGSVYFYHAETSNLIASCN